jgi:hypothetical protein
MKLLFVTSLKEYQKTVVDIFNKSGIPVFSVTETIGFKDHHKVNLLDNWFSRGTEKFDSIFVFSFTEEVRAEKALELIKQYNAENETGFPIRAFVVPVEKSSYQTAS